MELEEIPNNPKVKTTTTNEKSEKWRIKVEDSYFQSQNLMQRYSSYENCKDL